MRIQIKKLTNTACLPSAGSDYAAGYDLRADLQEPVTIEPGETKKINTGLAMEIPAGYFGAIFARSGLATREGVRPANCVGVIDADYRGPIIVALYNDSHRQQVIEPQERIAQIVFLPFMGADFVETDELSDSVRGEGGFGSTGSM